MNAVSTDDTQSNEVAEASDEITAKIKVELAESGPKAFVRRRTTIEGLEGSWDFGVSGAWREKYGTELGEFPEEATTNEVFAAALLACMTGSFAGVLRTRGIELTRDTLEAEAEVKMGPADDDGLWIIRSVDLHLTATLPEEDHATAERVHGIYHKECTLSQTLKGGRCKVSSTLSFA